ncbi:hypothetical protein LS482_16050 [Sinomicrobium kalidii]|uniref:hypothetical protein n=1 Tax=Sinomicrobium kalidii TaxID=2900738 RepID=UPI001E330155|nr:hypothetical protein [Sinomicrobium kalidii]UGU15185.1 hypothetical protein LS482_16050 [Sinomicrobium kalidii]
MKDDVVKAWCDKQELLNRQFLLQNVLAWTFEHNQGLTPGQRICLNQERAGIMQALEALEFGHQIIRYMIPAHLEEKVQHIAMVIRNTGWEKNAPGLLSHETEVNNPEKQKTT